MVLDRHDGSARASAAGSGCCVADLTAGGREMIEDFASLCTYLDVLITAAGQTVAAHLAP